MNKQNPKIIPETWVIFDKRAGTLQQAIAVAELIGMPFKIITPEYSKLNALPNFILPASSLRIKRKNRLELKNITNYPKIIIGAGRKSANISCFIKNQAKLENIKIVNIHIMNPQMNFNFFDLIILPDHDKVNYHHNNIVRINGAINNINRSNLEQAVIKFQQTPLYQKIDLQAQNKIALLIGGSSKNSIFEPKSMQNLIEHSCKIAKEMSAQLLILNSRRTSNQLNEIIKSSLDGNYYFFDCNDKDFNQNNPYLAILGIANFIIATGDSISMISEALNCGKAIYIFDEKKISTKKHRLFHQYLFKNKFANKFDKNIIKLESTQHQYSSQTLKITTKLHNLNLL